MPELPEVETIRRSLEPALLGARVLRVRVLRRDVISTPADRPAPSTRSPSTPARLRVHDLLAHAEIAALTRLGKRLAIIARDGRTIEIRLGMSGQLLLQRDPSTPPHTHVAWTLAEGARLLFRDPRRFGGVRVHTSDADLLQSWQSLGPDALSIRPGDLRARAGTSRRTLKAVLLDQRVLAGVGNIYADESLFEARLHPAALACDLDPRAWSQLARSIREVLARAIDQRGSTLRDYRDAEGNAGNAQLVHRVYARGGLPCPCCSAMLLSQTLAQRTTTWCPTCQPAPTGATP